jgi:hypothetical protein
MTPAIRVQWGFVLWVFRDLSVMAQALLAGEEVHLGVELKVLFRAIKKNHTIHEPPASTVSTVTVCPVASGL